MKTQPFHFEILAVLLISVIPWPGPSVFKISCPRERASVVRRIIQKRWVPILKKYQVELPVECPFHDSRDIFRPQQKAKQQHRPSQWTCGLCGKSFYAERHLEAHFDNRHKSNVNTAEDAVCLADYCDIMRCDILERRDFASSTDEDAEHLNTDIQVWRENTEQRTISISPCQIRAIARTYQEKSCAVTGGGVVSNLQRYCQETSQSILDNHQLHESAYNRDLIEPEKKKDPCKEDSRRQVGEDEDDDADDDDDDDDDDDKELEEEEEEEEEQDGEEQDEKEKEEEDDEDQEDDAEDEENLVEAAFPAVDKKQRRKRLHLRKLKSNCKPEELQKLKLQCEVLVRDCIAGLLTNLSLRDFQEIEGELNRAICWYLSCDRYWEDTKKHQHHTSWYLLTIFLVILFTSVYACYYVIWVLFNSTDEERIDGSGHLDYSGRDIAASSPLHDSSGRNESRLNERRKGDSIDNPLNTNEDMPDHYIYVAYPPDLKRRLLESCYNRTTRL